ncbi:MAG: HAD family hydrolase [Erysipelotrichaceae bacterium]|nr:HAD family hydrolase [Erysipelotrichaceae bacterium]
MEYRDKIKIFYFDLDSTTYDHNDDCIRESTYEGLRKLKEKGYKVCLNTSRSYAELYNAPKDFLELFDTIILISGAYIIKDNKVSVKKFKRETIDKLIKYFDEHELTYRYSTVDGGGYLNRHDEDKEGLFKRLYDMIPPIKKYEGEDVIGFIFYADKDIREEVYTLLDKEKYSDLRVGGEIYPEDVDKGKSMVKDALSYGFKEDEICAFGDSNNDVSMFKKAGLSVAMGTCSPMARDNADYVTEDISDEGLYKALMHFGFIGE